MSFPYSVQQEDLTEWIQQYTASEVEEVHSAACTIRHWRGYIQNSRHILLTCGKLKLSQDPLAVLEDSKNGKEIRL